MLSAPAPLTLTECGMPSKVSCLVSKDGRNNTSNMSLGNHARAHVF
jgi:hypothetical protein